MADHHQGLRVSAEEMEAFASMFDAHAEEVAEAMAAAGNDPDKVDWSQISDHLTESWEEIASKVAVDRGKRTVWQNMNDEEREAFTEAFLVDNPYIEPWLKEHGATLITEISQQTRDAVNRTLLDAKMANLTVQDIKRKVKNQVGLLERDAAAVDQYYQECLASGMSEDEAAMEQAAYADELITRRAENIARTETAFAASNGTQAAWMIASDCGIIPDTSRKVWIAGAGERTCDICGALSDTFGDDEDGIGIEEDFVLPEYGISVPCPPAHPQCRCTMGLVTPAIKAIDKEQVMPSAGVPEDKQDQWKAVYDKCIADGDDEETAAKKAWGAIRAQDSAPQPVAPQEAAAEENTPSVPGPKSERVQSSMMAKIAKLDQDQQVVFGWLSVSTDEDGNLLEDHQGHMIPPEVLEKAVYEFVLDFRKMGDMHERTNGIGRLIESVVLTREKQDAMGIPPGCVPEGWWVGFKVDDNRTWKAIRSGNYEMMSIGGEGILEEINAADDSADAPDLDEFERGTEWMNVEQEGDEIRFDWDSGMPGGGDSVWVNVSDMTARASYKPPATAMRWLRDNGFSVDIQKMASVGRKTAVRKIDENNEEDVAWAKQLIKDYEREIEELHGVSSSLDGIAEQLGSAIEELDFSTIKEIQGVLRDAAYTLQNVPPDLERIISDADSNDVELPEL